GLPPKSLLRAIQAAVEKVPEMPEWIDAALKKQHAWPTFSEALRAAHAPAREPDLDPLTPARQRLAYDELLANQLALLLIRARARGPKGRVFKGDGRFRSRVVAALPFKLTDAQNAATVEIDRDMAAPTRMLRLLQGDVGSGKTIVAMMAILNAVEC